MIFRTRRRLREAQRRNTTLFEAWVQAVKRYEEAEAALSRTSVELERVRELALVAKNGDGVRDDALWDLVHAVLDGDSRRVTAP